MLFVRLGRSARCLVEGVCIYVVVLCSFGVIGDGLGNTRNAFVDACHIIQSI